MNPQIKVISLSQEYPEILWHVLVNGAVRESRVGKTKELVGLSLCIRQPEHCIVDRDGYTDEFRDLEIAMLLAGTYDAELTAKVLPRAAELIVASTAYGPRVVDGHVDQLESCDWELTNHPDSRRAIVYIGRPDDLHFMHGEHVGDRKNEMPCTAIWQFVLRDGRLDMIVYMRSWDLVWGLSYDVPCFVANQMALAKSLGAEVGEYVHVSGSAHIYERHFNTQVRSTDRRLEIPWLSGESIEQTRNNALEEIKHMRREHGLT